jgi:pyridoxal phosphate enzyme (YggS family)
MVDEITRMSPAAEPAAVDARVGSALGTVRARIAAAAEMVGRDPAEVTLVAVSKAQPDARVIAALEAGQRVFGENYVQEAKARWPALRAARYPDLVLHMIGPIQTNKARDVVATFDVIETVDRPKLARVLAAEMARQGRRPVCFVQVNTGEEPQKAGVAPTDADAFIAECRRLELPVVGMMTIPPEDEEPSLHFALLADIAKRNGLGQLSMGMSADYEIAVQFGATHVRVGSAIFGERPPKPGA